MNFQCFLINLNKDTERYAFMDAQLQSLGLRYQRVEAVYGKEYLDGSVKTDVRYDKTLSDKHNKLGRSLTPGEIGCAISHHNVYKKIIDNGIDFALILEDDIKFDPSFNNELYRLLDNHQAISWDLIQFAYPNASNLRYILRNTTSIASLELQRLCRKFSLRQLFRLFFAPVFNFIFELRTYFLIKHCRGPFRNNFRNYAGAGCYLISNKAAQYLYEQSIDLVYTADVLIVKSLFQAKQLRCGSYFPPLARQDLQLFPSSIDEISKREIF